MLRNILLFCSLVFFIVPNVHSQLIIQEIRGARPSASTNSNYQTMSTDITLTLPFFDDFSDVETEFVSPALWDGDGGCIVNNTIGIEPPSKNVVTFDGINALGTPYDVDNLYAHTKRDSLKSHCIDLSTLAIGDDVYLSFYYQAKGNSELPDEEDSLTVEFYNNSGEWESVWRKIGDIPTDELNDFVQVFVKVEKNTFFHEKFRFKFTSYGKSSGAFDIWNVDYIYLNQGRSPSEEPQFDIATSLQPGKLLTPYTAMPMNQFKLNPSKYLTDSVHTTINNFKTSGADVPIGHECQLIDLIALGDLGTFVMGSDIGTPTSSLVPVGEKQFKVHALPVLDDIPLTADSLRLETKFIFETTDTYQKNDTISSITDLTDYYAYDDGSAEAIVSIPYPLDKIAQRFTLEETDILTGFYVYFPYSGVNLSGESFRIKVWSEINTDDNTFVRIHQQSEILTYSTKVDQYNYIPISYERAVKGTIYVGIEQLGSSLLTFGLDRTTSADDNIFFSISGNWIQNDGDIKGSIMLRPVFGKPVVSGVNRTIEEKIDIHAFPNPCTSFLHVEGEFTELTLTDLHGKVIKTVEKGFSDDCTINVQNLSKGVYYLKCKNESKFGVKKIIIQ